MQEQPPATAIERRSSKRQAPIVRTFASLDGRTVVVHDISVGGISIVGLGATIAGRHLLELHLQRHHLVLKIEIVAQGDNGTVHARFIDPPDLLRRLLHDSASAR
ncbi:MAG: hypothetical protein KDI82_03515 [Gammaproteobacteria bacterium]|nr:hypothetical protein [Gammaproteobacteria bacterium]